MPIHPPNAREGQARRPSQGRTSVLIVEDEPSIAETIAYLLRGDGFDMAIAHTGPAGLRAFQALEPDLILLDLMLPHLLTDPGRASVTAARCRSPRLGDAGHQVRCL